MRASTKSGVNCTDMQTQNRSAIIRHLMKNGICTRAELSRMTGLTQAAVTKIVADLIAGNVIEEDGVCKGENGRRSIALRLCTDKFYIVSIRFTRGPITVGLLNMAGVLFEQVQVDTGSLSQEEALFAVEEEIHRLCRIYHVVAIGVAVPGPYLYETGIVAKLTEKTGWDRFNVKRFFSKSRFHLPCFIEHDANAGALAIRYFEEVDSRILVHLLLTDGVGAGVLIHDKLLLGTNGIAGEIGHMCIEADGRPCSCARGARGCLEQYCSSLSFLRDVKAELPQHPQSVLSAIEQGAFTVKDVFSAAQEGDSFAVHMTKQVGRYIGIGIANIINLYNPDTIILSGVMTQGGSLLLEQIEKTVRQRIVPVIYQGVKIKCCTLQQDVILLGATAVVIDHFLSDPFAFIEPFTKAGEKNNGPVCTKV